MMVRTAFLLAVIDNAQEQHRRAEAEAPDEVSAAIARGAVGAYRAMRLTVAMAEQDERDSQDRRKRDVAERAGEIEEVIASIIGGHMQ